jgi:hypothetical protein
MRLSPVVQAQGLESRAQVLGSLLGQLGRLSDAVAPLSAAVAMHAETADVEVKAELSALGSFAELHNNLGVGVLKAADAAGDPLPYEAAVDAFNRGVVRTRVD